MCLRVLLSNHYDLNDTLTGAEQGAQGRQGAGAEQARTLPGRARSGCSRGSTQSMLGSDKRKKNRSSALKYTHIYTHTLTVTHTITHTRESRHTPLSC